MLVLLSIVIQSKALTFDRALDFERVTLSKYLSLLGEEAKN